MDQRVRLLNDAPVAPRGGYILYWCRWNRRVEANHALAYACGLANRMNLPLVVYQRVTAAYPTACDRFHTFELQGVPGFAAAVRRLGAGFVFQMPRRKHAPGDDRRVVFAGAALIVTDDCPRAAPPLPCAVDRGRFQLYRAHERHPGAQLRRLRDPPPNP